MQRLCHAQGLRGLFFVGVKRSWSLFPGDKNYSMFCSLFTLFSDLISGYNKPCNIFHFSLGCWLTLLSCDDGGPFFDTPSNIHLAPKLEESGRCFYAFSFWKMFLYVFFSRMIPKTCKCADLKQCRMIGICLWYPRFLFTHNTQRGLEANKTPADGWHMDSWWNKLPCIFHSSWFHLAVFKAHMNILVQQGN